MDPSASHRFAANWAQDVPRLVLRVLSAFLSPPNKLGGLRSPQGRIKPMTGNALFKPMSSSGLICPIWWGLAQTVHRERFTRRVRRTRPARRIARPARRIVRRVRRVRCTSRVASMGFARNLCRPQALRRVLPQALDMELNRGGRERFCSVDVLMLLTVGTSPPSYSLSVVRRTEGLYWGALWRQRHA